MPLTGEAKTDYQRVYMRQTRLAMRQAKRKVAATTGEILRGAALVSAGANVAAQNILKDRLDREGLPIELTLRTVKELHTADRPYGKDAIPGADNDARARACDIALRLHERAGTIPAIAQQSGGGPSLHITVLHFSSPSPTTSSESQEPTAIVEVN